MGTDTIDGIILKRMIISGANKLDSNKQVIDALNVFPVPDGDTGTNMSYTVMASAREVEHMQTPNAHDVMKAAAGGSLRGARGNSGVILSQLFRGFAKGLEGCSVIKVDDLANAFSKGVETAYKAVMKPKEGTILTVARAVAEKAVEVTFDVEDLEFMLREIIVSGSNMLERTTAMLPELAQADVVDAGGKGLICFLEGCYEGLMAGHDISLSESKDIEPALNAAARAEADIKNGYCTEFFINVASENEETEEYLKKYLASAGDSIVVAAEGTIIKVHIHTNHPGAILEHSMKFGPLSNLKIENMRMQHTSLISFSSTIPSGVEEAKEPDKSDGPTKEIGFVAVAAGQGITDLFKGMGVDEIIEGGQTMNPSTEDILRAAKRVNAENVIVLPNNKNIILAAKQARELIGDRGGSQKIHVLETTTIPQGFSAMLRYLSTAGIDENIQAMSEAAGDVVSGQVTYAVRDSVIDDKTIRRGDILCMADGKIEVVASDLLEGVKELLDIMLKKGGEFVSIYYGEDVTKQEAEEVVAYVDERYGYTEVELRDGGQPLYYYILSVE